MDDQNNKHVPTEAEIARLEAEAAAALDNWLMTGRIEFDGYSPEEIKLIFSRYNGNVRHITAYGEKAYAYFVGLSEAEESGYSGPA